MRPRAPRWHKPVDRIGQKIAGTREMGHATWTHPIAPLAAGHLPLDAIPAGHPTFDASPNGAPPLLRSSRTAHSAEPVRHPGRRIAPSRDPDGRPARATGSPGSRCTSPGMTAKRMWRTLAPCSVVVVGARRLAGLSSRDSAPSFDVIPDGPQGRAGTSSRTAHSAEPGFRRASRKCRWIPAFAGMTAKRMRRTLAPCSVVVVGARRRAGLSSRTAPNFDVIPDGA